MAAMKRRTQRVSNLIRNVVSELVRTRLSDPRIDPARVSITRVEMPEDLMTARVFVSVIGSDADHRRTLSALSHSRGHIQELLMRQIQLRNTPLLEFVVDTQFKKTIATLQILSQVAQEIRQKDEQRAHELGLPVSAEPADPVDGRDVDAGQDEDPDGQT